MSFPRRDADAIVIGAGAAGSMAALAAAHHGVRDMLAATAEGHAAGNAL